MSYVNFKALVKKVNIKPKGVQEIVLEVSNGRLDGQLELLAQMVDSNAIIEMDSTVVNYNVTLNAATKEPLIEYKVNQSGVVEEVKKHEQLELDGLPKAKIKTKNEEKQIEKEIVDSFILEGLAPSYDDMPSDMSNIVKRRLQGESFSKLASELEISSGKIAELTDEYRSRVAALAAKWHEWKLGQENEDVVNVKDDENGEG